jgi:anti-anti-sigma factor
MESEFQVEGGALRVRLSGRLTGEGAAPLFQDILSFLPKSRQVIVNMARVEYVSSSGIGQMVSLYKDLRDRGGALVIAGASERVKGLFDLAGMSQIIDYAETEADALEQLSR